MKPGSSSRLPRLLLAGAGALALSALGAAPTQSCGPLPGGGTGGTDAGVTRPVCGDGVASGMEQCDGTILGGATCEMVLGGGRRGTIRCDPNTCTFDTRGCTLAICGDGKIEGHETCEGSNVGGVTCGGSDVGTVTCDPRYCGLDTSKCKPATCGNGRKDEFEDCDGQDFGGETCQSVSGGDPNAMGPLTCTATCRYDARECIPRPGFCGDGALQAPYETCDGDMPCQQYALTQGRPADYYTGGFVPCDRMTCTLGNDALCDVNRSHCGNGIIERQYGETCDGANIGAATCLTGGFLFGVPRCTTSCQIHYFAGCFGGCVAAGRGVYCQ